MDSLHRNQLVANIYWYLWYIYLHIFGTLMVEITRFWCKQTKHHRCEKTQRHKRTTNRLVTTFMVVTEYLVSQSICKWQLYEIVLIYSKSHRKQAGVCFCLKKTKQQEHIFPISMLRCPKYGAKWILHFTVWEGVIPALFLNGLNSFFQYNTP